MRYFLKRIDQLLEEAFIENISSICKVGLRNIEFNDRKINIRKDKAITKVIIFLFIFMLSFWFKEYLITNLKVIFI